MELNQLKVSVLGTGNMGKAIILGLLDQGLPASQLRFYDLGKNAYSGLSEALIKSSAVNRPQDLLAGGAILIAAVKPGQMKSALTVLENDFKEDNILVSIAAGISTAQLRSFLPNAPCLIVRAMPNTPMLVQKGAAAFCFEKELANVSANSAEISAKKQIGDSPSSLRTAAKQAIELLFSPLGLCLWVNEEQMDAVTAISGSGPAFVAVFVEAMIDAGVNCGLDRKTVTQLSVATLAGSAEMLLKKDLHPVALKEMVTSPGGTTIAGIASLEQAGFRAAIFAAVRNAWKRSKQLAKRQ